MILIDTTNRTTDAEIMDDFSLEGEMLRESLDNIASINKFLGGNSVTIDGVELLIKTITPSQEITIIDLGCGNGDMLRELSKYAEKNNRIFRLIGVDANQFTIKYARELSVTFPNISYISQNIFSSEFENLKYDIALCTLTLHHFKEPEVLQLMNVLLKNSKTGIVVNDLQRSGLAYRLFQIVGFVFRLHPMAKEDGLVSIRRGFKREDLVSFSEKLKIKNYTIRWKWAFRHQWIISKI